MRQPCSARGRPCGRHLSADKFSPVQPSAEVCAIVGGAVTVTGMIDSFIYRSHQTILKKMRIGKLG